MERLRIYFSKLAWDPLFRGIRLDVNGWYCLKGMFLIINSVGFPGNQ